ncbi:MAG: 50S ribosomal protein L13 [bacterium]
MRTPSMKKGEVPSRWLVIDAEGQVLGRLASEVAVLLLGKGKPEYTAHVQTGDHVVVINATKIRITGTKADTKRYTHHSGYYGGFKSVSFRRMKEEHPDQIIRKAVWGMLPKGRMGRAIHKNLFVYPDAGHPHTAQNPEAYALRG